MKKIRIDAIDNIRVVFGGQATQFNSEACLDSLKAQGIAGDRCQLNTLSPFGPTFTLRANYTSVIAGLHEAVDHKDVVISNAKPAYNDTSKIVIHVDFQ